MIKQIKKKYAGIIADAKTPLKLVIPKSIKSTRKSMHKVQVTNRSSTSNLYVLHFVLLHATASWW